MDFPDAHLASVSNEAVAGATIALRIMMFTLMPAWGLSNAAATLVGQNLGAGQPERAESSVWKIGFYNMAFMIFVSVIFLLARSADRAVHRRSGRDCHRRRRLQILSYSYFTCMAGGWCRRRHSTARVTP